jgi:hypothetical protein
MRLRAPRRSGSRLGTEPPLPRKEQTNGQKKSQPEHTRFDTGRAVVGWVWRCAGRTNWHAYAGPIYRCSNSRAAHGNPYAGPTDSNTYTGATDTHPAPNDHAPPAKQSVRQDSEPTPFHGSSAQTARRTPAAWRGLN